MLIHLELRCWTADSLNSLIFIGFRMAIVTRVDVSETFSPDQPWFRILSGLFQRCSLPENLWSALIQLWTALKTEIFRAKNQCWNSAVSALIFSETELISADVYHVFWTSAEKRQNYETALFSADYLWDFNSGTYFSISLFKIKRQEFQIFVPHFKTKRTIMFLLFNIFRV